MSDEQEGRRPRPDETREFSPFDDETPDDGTPGKATSGEARSGQARSGDETRVAGNQPDGRPRTGDAPTEQVPRGPADDATVIAPGLPRDATAVQPPVRDWTSQDAAWAGRAEVRPPRPGQSDYGTTSDWEARPPAEPRGKWWMPIVIGIVALVLLGLLGRGIYLITQAEDGSGTPAPGTSVSAPATRATTTPATTEPTTTAPTTTPPTTEPPQTTDPVSVNVPALVGLSQQDAQQALERRGLRYRVIARSNDASPGTVIDCDPPEGQEVPADTQVTLIVSAERTEPTTQPTDTGQGPDEQD